MCLIYFRSALHFIKKPITWFAKQIKLLVSIRSYNAGLKRVTLFEVKDNLKHHNDSIHLSFPPSYIVNFEDILHITLVLSLFSSNMYLPAIGWLKILIILNI